MTRYLDLVDRLPVILFAFIVLGTSLGSIALLAAVEALVILTLGGRL